VRATLYVHKCHLLKANLPFDTTAHPFEVNTAISPGPSLAVHNPTFPTIGLQVIDLTRLIIVGYVQIPDNEPDKKALETRHLKRLALSVEEWQR
jgi:hypothetical protein